MLIIGSSYIFVFTPLLEGQNGFKNQHRIHKVMALNVAK